MDTIIDELVAFAQVNGRLPCPDTDGDGVENDVAATTACAGYFGFLPGRTLGSNGKFNAAGLMIDPWGSGYGYAVSNVNVGAIPPGNTNIDLVTANGIRDEGIANVLPDLFICDDSNALGNDLNCGAVSGAEVVANVAAVIISLGKDFRIPASSNIQAENLDDFGAGTADKVYIFSPRRDDYDDVVRWISTNLLYSRMIEADQLP